MTTPNAATAARFGGSGRTAFRGCCQQFGGLLVKIYEGANIRNVALVGHSHSGKTSLTSAMLFTAGATQRLGRVDEGTTTTDYEEEEISRAMSLSASAAVVEWGKSKINIIDTPGFNMFIHEAEMALPAVEAAIVVVDAVSGVEVVTERIWNYAEKLAMPRVIVCTRMDRERADYTRVMDSLTAAFGRTVVPVQLPIGSEKSFTGVIDLVKMKAYTYDMGGNGRAKVGDIPANMAEEAKAAHERLVESVAEGDDALMEEFFENGTIGEEHIISGLHNAIREDKMFPVLFASGLGNMGTDEVLDFIVDYMPTAVERGTITAAPTANNGEPAVRKVSDSEPVSLYFFKTISDPFAGRISYFKVYSGVLKNDATLQNFNRSTSEKLAHISVMQGKTAIPVNELHAGDIGAVAKLKDTLTGDTMGDKAAPIQYPQVKFEEPAITFAIEPKTRADEDKLSNGIHKLMEEDAMLRFFRDAQTKEFLIAGTGQQHIEVVVSKLKNRYHTEVNLKAPKVPYRETIRGRADVQGRHKKQSGGHGQFGDCKIKMEPLPRGGQFEFVNDIFGGAIPEELHSRRRKRHCRSGPARLPCRLSGRRLPGDAVRRFVPRRRLERTFLQDRRPHCLPQSHGTGQAHAAGAGHECRDHHPRRVRRRHHGRPEQPSRPHSGHGQQGRQDHRESRSAHGRDADLRHRPHVYDAGARQLLHGDESLRRRPGSLAGEDHRSRQGRTRRGSGRRRVENQQLAVGFKFGCPILLRRFCGEGGSLDVGHRYPTP